MAAKHFDMWTDYLSLSKVVESIIESHHTETHSKMDPMERKLRTELFDKQSWKELGNSRQTERRDLKGSATQLQHKAADMRSHRLTMEIGTGFFLTINIKGIEEMHCEDETKRHHLLDGSVESQHMTDSMNRDGSTESQLGLFGWKSSRKDALTQRCKGAVQRHNLLEDLFQSTVSSGTKKELSEPLVIHSWGDVLPVYRGKDTKCSLTGAQSISKISQVSNICTFCKQNGESKKTYTSHVLKDAEGKILCPILRGYICPLCNATGDNAHTKRFCHLLQGNYRSMYKKVSRDTAFIKK